MKSSPLVSICCITYNHESYIKACLEGFLMQKCNFDYEIIIYDDASTDKTRKIINAYQSKYPDIIKPILQKENQYSKGVRGINFHFNFPRSIGKYIALCEGDDYWTDPLKLQKQVEFLENHPDFILTVGGFKKKKEGKEEIVIKANNPAYINETEQGFEFDLFSPGWLTKTLTSVFKADKNILNKLHQYKYARDVHLNYHLLKAGKGYYFKEVLGVYNIHVGGIFSMNSQKKKDVDHFLLYQELYRINHDEFSRQKYFEYLIRYLRWFRRKEIKLSVLSYASLLKEGWSIHKGDREKEAILKMVPYKRLKKIYHKIFR